MRLLLGGQKQQEEQKVVILAEVEEGQQVEVLEEAGQWVAGEVLEVDDRLAMVKVEEGGRRWVDRAVVGLRVVDKDQGPRNMRRTVRIAFEGEEREVRWGVVLPLPRWWRCRGSECAGW